LKKEDLFALHTRTYILDNKTLVFTGTDNDFVQKISQQFPKEQQQIEKFFQEAKRATEEMVATFKNPNLPCPTYEAWEKVTYQQKLDEFFYDKELKGILCSLLGYLGTKAEQTEAHKALLWCLRYFIYGGYYPKQGGKRFADALRQVIESHNGAVLTHARVDEILVTDGNVRGVRVCDKTFFSPIVVANANAKLTFLHLIPKGTLPESFTNAINSLKMSKSEAVVHLGVDMDLSNLSSLIRVSLPQTKCCFFINSNADPSTAPLRQASISIGMTSLYNETPPNETTEYAAYKEALLEKAIINVEKIIPGIRNHIVEKEVVTPRTFEHFTSMPEGALYAFDQSEGSVRPYFKTPIPGLYLASASTLLGGGVETVTISGMRCAQDIMHSNPSCTSAFVISNKHDEYRKSDQ
jgi:all-trans-retinol 13,14-reductase